MKLPMREKCVDEAVGIWCILGEYQDGNVNVTDGTNDIFSGGIPKAVAEELVRVQEAFRTRLYDLLCRPVPPPEADLRKMHRLINDGFGALCRDSRGQGITEEQAELLRQMAAIMNGKA